MNTARRDVSLDFLRGLAVIFMVMQHLAVWLWDTGWSKSLSLFKEAPVYNSLIAFSALSAPVFLFTAGCGAFLFMQKYKNSAKIIRRGLILLCAGYLSVMIIDTWFSAASWYVLQSIGFCFLTVPLLRRLDRRRLILLFLVIAGIAVAGQYLLETPLAYGNRRMADTSLAFAPLRLAFFEGHFPVFPWWGIFVLGYYFGLSVQENRYAALIKPAYILALLGGLLVAAGILFPSLTADGITRYIFSYRVRFYPLLLPILFLLASASCISLYLIHGLCSVLDITQNNPVTAIGRLALTAFLTHIFIKQVVYSLGYADSFTKWQVIGITVLLLSLYASYSLLLRKRGYPFTLEWLFRKLG